MDAKTLQTILSKAGTYTGAIDGVAGPQTRAAVEAFQRSRGLQADGIVGPATLAALQAASGAPAQAAAPTAAMVFPTYADLKPIFPFSKRAILEPYAQQLPTVAAAGGINRLSRVWHFIGQCAHESDQFKTREEYASGKAYEGRKDLGNTHPGDGVRFKGRAEIQCTGRANYEAATLFVRKLLREPAIDLVATPEIIVQRADVSMAVDIWYWTQGSKHYGDLSLIADRDRGDSDLGPNSTFMDVVETITHAINGGSNGLPDRVRYTVKVRALVLKLNGR